MKISKIDLAGRTFDEIFEGIAPEKIACCNWAEDFPYAPDVTFKMFHTGDKLYIRFDVEEQYTAARITEDNGDVWTDSCCEFFFSLDGKAYYNIECNCIGRMLCGHYTEKGAPALRAGAEILSQVERITSLGYEPFEERVGDNKWSLQIIREFGKEIQSGLFFHFVNADGKYLQWLIGRTVRNNKTDHFLRWSQVIS